MKILLPVMGLLSILGIATTLTLWKKDNASLWQQIGKDQQALADSQSQNSNLKLEISRMTSENGLLAQRGDSTATQIQAVLAQRDFLMVDRNTIAEKLNAATKASEGLETKLAQQQDYTKSLEAALSEEKSQRQILEQRYSQSYQNYLALYSNYKSLEERSSSSQITSGGIHYDQLSGDAAAAYAPSHAHTYTGTVITSDGEVENVQGTSQ